MRHFTSSGSAIVRAALPSKLELYHIANDPEEAQDQAETYPDRVKELLVKLNAYAYEMTAAKYLQELGKGGRETPIFWGHNSPQR